jgi:uncharacterized membrane protein YfcA
MIYVIAIIIGAAIGFAIGQHKGRPALGLILGALLGFIGWIIVAVIPPTRAKLVEREQRRLTIQRDAQRGIED